MAGPSHADLASQRVKDQSSGRIRRLRSVPTMLSFPAISTIVAASPRLKRQTFRRLRLDPWSAVDRRDGAGRLHGRYLSDVISVLETARDLVVSCTENVDPDRVRAARELEDASVEVSETLRSATWERAQPPTRFRFEGGGRGLW